MSTPRFYLWEAPVPRLVKIAGGQTTVLRDGAWHEAPELYARVTGLAGDADAHPITEAEARRMMTAEGVTA
jgi:hypothetical protein